MDLNINSKYKRYKILEVRDGLISFTKEELESLLDDCYIDGFNAGLLADRPKESSITNQPYNPFEVDHYGYPYYLDRTWASTKDAPEAHYSTQASNRDDSAKESYTCKERDW